jgi:hypothetical protein
MCGQVNPDVPYGDHVWRLVENDGLPGVLLTIDGETFGLPIRSLGPLYKFTVKGLEKAPFCKKCFLKVPCACYPEIEGVDWDDPEIQEWCGDDSCHRKVVI